MNKTKKIVVISIAVAALLLLFALTKLVWLKNDAKTPIGSQDTALSSKNAAPGASQSATNAQPQFQDKLDPLPVDDKKAIDSELSNIDKELQATDNSVKSSDLSNDQLGL